MNLIPYISEIIGAIMFVAISIPMKTIKLHFLHKSFVTSLVLFIFSLIFILYEKYIQKNDYQIIKNSIQSKNIILSVVYIFFILGIAIGFEYCPISIALPLFMLATPITLVLGKLINNSDITIEQIIGSIIILAGVTLCVFKKEKFEIKYIYGIISILLASISISYVFTVIKKQIPNNIHSAFYKTNIEIFDFNYISVIILGLLSLSFSIFTKKMPSLINMGKVFIYIFLFQYIGYQFYYYALNKLPVDDFAIITNVEVIVSLFFGSYFFKEKITLFKILGIVLIIIGVLFGINHQKKINNN